MEQCKRCGVGDVDQDAAKHGLHFCTECTTYIAQLLHEAYEARKRVTTAAQQEA